MTPDFTAELAAAQEKYPADVWRDMPIDEMLDALESEVSELAKALYEDKLHGPHGILREALHVQVVAQRIADEMTRRSEREICPTNGDVPQEAATPCGDGISPGTGEGA